MNKIDCDGKTLKIDGKDVFKGFKQLQFEAKYGKMFLTKGASRKKRKEFNEIEPDEAIDHGY